MSLTQVMQFARVPALLLAWTWSAWAQTTTPDVGSGAPNDSIRFAFIQAYFRYGFNALVSLPPVADVQKLGTTGYWQLFYDAAKTSGVRYALVKPTAAIISPTGSYDVFQMYPGIYSYFNSLGVSTIGYPTMDTTPCPALASNACTYQYFDKNYILIVYQQATPNGANFYIRDPFYTKWQAVGGFSALGPPTALEQSVQSSAGTSGTLQTYLNGALFNITSGLLSGRLLPVIQPIYSTFLAYGGYAGSLGFPASEQTTLSDGRIRQSFEGGAIEYTLGSDPVVKPPVLSVAISITPVRQSLTLGDSVTLKAMAEGAGGASLADRSFVWTTSNSRVLSLKASGDTAVVTAVGDGTAQVRAVSEGVASVPVTFVVTAPCCLVGEGSPSEVVRQAFLDAVTRHNLALKIPAPAPVQRLGNGYVQAFLAADPQSTAQYLLAKPDDSAAVYVLTGALLARYQELGGPAGALGYPEADATAGGTQVFQNGALAGAPVQVVSDLILSKWSQLGYETGPAGPPTGAPSAFLTFTATAGLAQTFRGGAIYTASTGPRAGKAYFSSGLILARYTALGGVTGSFGMPATDEFGSGGRRRQEFEGGFIDYAPGDATAQATASPRQPAVTATPDYVVAGGRVRLAAGGFAAASTLRVSISGQPDFLVKTDNGAYAWEIVVPASAASGVVTVRAAEASGAASATGSYTVAALNDAPMTLAKTRGDGQTGLPGALLPQKLRVQLSNAKGGPVAGVTVRFTASPGGQVDPATTLTDANGEAETSWRLPASAGAALVLAEAARQVTPVTFGALTAPSTLTNFPDFRQSGQPALVAAAAAILRYHQNRAELPSPNGLADPASLNQFLTNFCAADLQGGQICDGFVSPPGSSERIANLWRAGAFAGNSVEVSVEKTDLSSIRDLVGQGSPVLLALALRAADAPAGSSFVVATGVAANGGIQILDPNPAFGRATLDEYLAGFQAGSRTWKGTVAAAVRLLPRAPASTGFLITAGGTAFDVLAVGGACGASVEWPAESGAFRARYCGGAELLYRLDVSGEGAYRLVFTDLNTPGKRMELTGAGPASYKIAKPLTEWLVTPQDLDFAASGVVNAASYTADIAPGGLISIFGSGLARASSPTTVEIGGLSAKVVAASAFQLNVYVPLELAPGVWAIRVTSPFGSLERQATFLEAAPEIFLLSAGWPAIVNQDGTINSPSAPARRGQVVTIYGTGFGAVTGSGNFKAAAIPVRAVLQNQELPVAFAGLAPGFVGLYQVNLPIPDSLPPGLGLPLVLKQGAMSSVPVEISVQ